MKTVTMILAFCAGVALYLAAGEDRTQEGMVQTTQAHNDKPGAPLSVPALPLAGRGASPFAALDCNPRTSPLANATVCHPEDYREPDPANEPLDVLGARIASGLVNGQLDKITDFNATLHECMFSGLQSEKRTPPVSLCDNNRLEQYVRQVEDSLEAAARSGSAEAQDAYLGLLSSQYASAEFLLEWRRRESLSPDLGAVVDLKAAQEQLAQSKGKFIDYLKRIPTRTTNAEELYQIYINQGA